MNSVSFGTHTWAANSLLRAKLAAGENWKEERESTTVLPPTEKVPESLKIPAWVVKKYFNFYSSERNFKVNYSKETSLVVRLCEIIFN